MVIRLCSLFGAKTIDALRRRSLIIVAVRIADFVQIRTLATLFFDQVRIAIHLGSITAKLLRIFASFCLLLQGSYLNFLTYF